MTEPPPLAIVGAAVFDGTGKPALPARTVLVRGGRVEWVGPVGELPPPPGAEVVDGAGCTLLPGFVDTHVHLDFYPPAEVPGAASPRLLAAGQIVTVPGGYPTRAAWAPEGTARPVADAAEATRGVAELAAAGAAVVKVALDDRVGPTLPGPVLAAVVAAARRHGLGVTAHVGTAREAEKALTAGVAEFAHWPFDRRTLPEGLIARLAASVTVVPTLHIQPSPARRRGVRRFVELGGRVLYGTDLGNQGPPPAVDVEELRLLVAAGLSPAQALAAATSAAADHLGLAGAGRVTPGAAADLLLVAGDPLTDLAALASVRLVTRDGRVASTAAARRPPP